MVLPPPARGAGTSQGASERRGILWKWRGPSGLRWVWRNGRGPHLEGPSYLEQEGRRGSDKLVPGPSVFPSREPSVLGNFCAGVGIDTGLLSPPPSSWAVPNTGRTLGLMTQIVPGGGEQGINILDIQSTIIITTRSLSVKYCDHPPTP